MYRNHNIFDDVLITSILNEQLSKYLNEKVINV